MIPDFKTYLRESIWSDMEDRGSGDTIKKEDDINLFGPEELADYLNERYKVKMYIGYAENDDGSEYVYVPLVDHGGYIVHLFRDFEPNNSVMLDDVIKYCNGYVYDRLKSKYKLKTKKDQNDNTYTFIYPKDGGEVDNNLFVEVIDFIIDNSQKPLEIQRKDVNESIWSDMQDRGSGDLVKKEDDANLLGPEDFTKYINDHYEKLRPKVGTGTTHEWRCFDNGRSKTVYGECCQILKNDYRNSGMDSFYNCGIQVFYKPDMTKVFMSYDMKHDKSIEVLQDKFDIFYNTDTQGFGVYGPGFWVEPKDGREINNQFVLSVIDTIIENCENPLMKKKSGV